MFFEILLLMPWKVEFLRRGCLRFSAGALQTRAPKWRDFDAKRIKQLAKKVPKTTEVEPKRCQNEPRNRSRHPLRTRIEKVRKRGGATRSLGAIFGQKSRKTPTNKSSKNRSPKNMKIDAKREPKGSQNRCKNSSKIYAKTGREKGAEKHGKSCFSDMSKVVNL